MRILLVSNAVVGGAGKACLRLFHALRHSGHDVKLLQLEGWISGDPDIVFFYPNVRDLVMRQITSFPLKWMRHMLLGDYRRRYRLPFSIHKLERHPLIRWADVINLHWVPEFVDYRRFFRRVGRKPVVWTMHDMLPFAGGYHYEYEMPQRRNRRTERRIAAIKQVSVREANLSIVAPSAWLLAVSEQHATFAGDPHSHIFNGLPLDVYQPIEKKVARSIMGLPQDRKIVLFTAYRVNSARKGSHHLVAALGKLKRSDVLLISMGRRRIELDCKADYLHLGWFADDVSIALCYSCADVVALPSIEDNSPNIVIESFACGRPVVAFDVGGIGQLIWAPYLGVLVEKADSGALAAGIDKALATDFDTDKIRADAVRRFSYDVLAEQYANLFGKLASQ